MRQIFRNKYSSFILALAASLIAVITMAIGMSGAAAAQTARDYSANSIISGGAATPQEFINNLEANNPSDLQTIYSSYGLTSGSYDDFRQNAKMGVAYKNGDINVDGQVVARDARSLGRERQSTSTRYTHGGKQYYETRHQDVFATNSIPVMVLLDSNGRYKVGVLTACGNPVRATPTTTTPTTQRNSCDMLQRTTVSGQEYTYSFTTRATVGSNVQVSRVVYDFGDGSATESRNSLTEAVQHTYSNPGTYQARVTVYTTSSTTSGTGQETALTSTACTANITVRERPAPVTPSTAPLPQAPQPPVAPQPIVAPVAPVAAPAVLPAAGVGEFAGLFAAVSVAGALGYHFYLRRQLARQ